MRNTPTEDLKQTSLTSPVRANDPEDLPAVRLETDVL
ncbi:uncharacterized protein METZ01_LOCUS381104 [marine metagenome]|uniref:Uncharacterized protein n=1 Tax=marine metagenome TaxID=408172 RepID=A0A382U1U8_9ZZZZ